MSDGGKRVMVGGGRGMVRDDDSNNDDRAFSRAE